MYTILGADGKEYGPVTVGHVTEWIRDGRANLETKAKNNREDVWKTLGEFVEFGGRTVPAVVEPSRLASPAAARPDAANAVSADASRWVRLPAAMIDGLLKTLCYLPITVPLVRTVATEALSGTQRSFAEISRLTTDVVNAHLPEALPYLGLLVLTQFILLGWRGQSIGKFLLRLRIVRCDDGGAPGLYRAFLLRGTVPFMIGQLPVVNFVFWLVDSCFIFRPDHRCVHDLIAGTRVVTA